MNKIFIAFATAFTLLMPACTTVVEQPVPAPVTEIETQRETRTTTSGFYPPTTSGAYPPTTTTTETRTLRTE